MKRISDVRTLRAHQFVEDAGPLAHPVRPSAYREINNFYTATVYEKGAEVVRMLKTLLGPAGFRSDMDLYFKRHDGEAATVDQYIQCFADATSTDLSQFMRWYAQSGTPEVVVNGAYDTATQTYRLDAAQSVPPTPGQPVKEPMVIPLVVGLVGADGRDMSLSLEGGLPVVRGVLTLTQPAQSFTFTDVPSRPVLSVNRGFSAPIRLTSNLTPEDLKFLAAHDSDPFNRWQAIQSLAVALLSPERHGDPRRRSAARRRRSDCGARCGVGRSGTRPAFIALTLAMPTEADIAREIGRDVDPDAIFAARAKLRGAIGAKLGPALRDTYRRMEDNGRTARTRRAPAGARSKISRSTCSQPAALRPSRLRHVSTIRRPTWRIDSRR